MEQRAHDWEGGCGGGGIYECLKFSLPESEKVA